MVSTPDEELIESAQAVLNPHYVGGRLFGDVGATLVTDRGNRYSGVCIDTGSGTGFCAEHSAIAAMVTAGEYRIAKIVAVWRDNEGVLYALPPWGRCREFMRQVDPANLDADVILGRNTTAKLSELLPFHDWPSPLHGGDEPRATMGSVRLVAEDDEPYYSTGASWDAEP